MKTLTTFLLIMMIALPCVAEDTASRLHFKINGYSIEPLEGTFNNMTYKTLTMFLPPTEGSSPNVTVQIQLFKGTFKQYADLSHQQIIASGFNILKENITKSSAIWEYTGVFSGRKLHWYLKAVPGKDRVYLVTAISTESQWVTMSNKLKSCVDSFKKEK